MDSNGTWSGVNWSSVQKGDFEITDPAVTPQALAKDTGVAQVDLLHIGVPNAGDDYNATVNGVTVSVTAQPGDTNATIAQALVNKLNLSEGLVAYYPFNGNANDASGNDFDGTVTGALS